MSKHRVPVVEGYFTEEGGQAHLLGGRCSTCGAFFFPKQYSFCRNPACGACPLARLCPSYGEGATDPVTAAKLVKTEGRA